MLGDCWPIKGHPVRARRGDANWLSTASKYSKCRFCTQMGRTAHTMLLINNHTLEYKGAVQDTYGKCVHKDHCIMLLPTTTKNGGKLKFTLLETFINSLLFGNKSVSVNCPTYTPEIGL